MHNEEQMMSQLQEQEEQKHDGDTVTTEDQGEHSSGILDGISTGFDHRCSCSVVEVQNRIIAWWRSRCTYSLLLVATQTSFLSHLITSNICVFRMSHKHDVR